MITFIVDGNPVPKQSFRYAGQGSYQTPRVKAWQDLVAVKAREAMNLTSHFPIKCNVAVRLVFVLKTRRRVDLDNLAKGTLDGMRGIVYMDDCQIVNLHLVKHVYPKAVSGVFVEIHDDDLLPFLDRKATLEELGIG